MCDAAKTSALLVVGTESMLLPAVAGWLDCAAWLGGALSTAAGAATDVEAAFKACNMATVALPSAASA